MIKNIVNFKMVNNKSHFSNVGSTAVNRINVIDQENNYARLVRLLLCCEYTKHAQLYSRLTKQQLRANFTKKERVQDLPKWIKLLQGDKIVKSWDIKDPKQLI